VPKILSLDQVFAFVVRQSFSAAVNAALASSPFNDRRTLVPSAVFIVPPLDSAASVSSNATRGAI